MVIHMLNPEIYTIKGQPSVHPQIEKKILLYKEKMLTDKATIKSLGELVVECLV